MTTALTSHDTERLAALESIIKEGRDSFLATGMALAQINRDRLYRAEFATFVEYLEKRWDISKSRGYQLIAFAKDVETSTTVDTPKNEFQSRKRKQNAGVEKSAGHKSVEDVNELSAPAPISDDQDPPHITAGLPDEDSATPVESSPSTATAEPDAATEVVQIIEAAITEADKEVLNRISVYCVTVPRKIKDAIRMRKL